ncbi:hypothetical protein HOD08_01475 [bacterium]|nr:hypothetical protein [bacterium]
MALKKILRTILCTVILTPTIDASKTQIFRSEIWDQEEVKTVRDLTKAVGKAVHLKLLWDYRSHFPLQNIVVSYPIYSYATYCFNIQKSPSRTESIDVIYYPCDKNSSAYNFSNFDTEIDLDSIEFPITINNALIGLKFLNADGIKVIEEGALQFTDIEAAIRWGIETEKYLGDAVGSVDLTGCGLSELPKFVSRLTNLKILVLADNNFKYVPQELESMEKLEVIDIRGTLIDECPRWCMNKLRAD